MTNCGSHRTAFPLRIATMWSLCPLSGHLHLEVWGCAICDRMDRCFVASLHCGPIAAAQIILVAKEGQNCITLEGMDTLFQVFDVVKAQVCGYRPSPISLIEPRHSVHRNLLLVMTSSPCACASKALQAHVSFSIAPSSFGTPTSRRTAPRYMPVCVSAHMSAEGNHCADHVRCKAITRRWWN